MLFRSALDASRGNPAVRFPANPKAVAALNLLPHPVGAYSGPEVLVSTTYDPAVPAGNTGWLSDRLKASFAKGKGKAPYKVATYYTVPPADGWTQFDPGAKGPNAAASIAALGFFFRSRARSTVNSLVASEVFLPRIISTRLIL